MTAVPLIAEEDGHRERRANTLPGLLSIAEDEHTSEMKVYEGTSFDDDGGVGGLFYRDEASIIQGPFPVSHFSSWVDQGYFSLTMHVFTGKEDGEGKWIANEENEITLREAFDAVIARKSGKNRLMRRPKSVSQSAWRNLCENAKEEKINPTDWETDIVSCIDGSADYWFLESSSVHLISMTFSIYRSTPLTTLWRR